LGTSKGISFLPGDREGWEDLQYRTRSRLTGQGRDMRTAVYALAGLAAASGVSAFMPQASFTGRAPSLRAGRSRPAVSVGEPMRRAPHLCKSASARHSAASNTHAGGQRRRRAGTPARRRRGATGGAPAVAALSASRHPGRTSSLVRVQTLRTAVQLFRAQSEVHARLHFGGAIPYAWGVPVRPWRGPL
jgi:hypothetical protein